MVSPHSQSNLDSLGFGAYVAGPIETIAWPGETVSHALVVSDLVIGGLAALFSVDPSMLSFLPGRSTVLQQRGLSFAVCSQNHKILRLTADDPTSDIHVRGIGEEGTAWCAADEPGTVYVDTNRMSRFALASQGSAVLLETGSGGIVLTPLVIAATEPLALTIPLEDWFRLCQDDWVRERIQAAANSKDAWQAIAAAGLLARLLEPASSKGSRALLAGLVRARGRESERLRPPKALYRQSPGSWHLQNMVGAAGDRAADAPRKWARSLPDPEVRRVEARALFESDEVARDLHDVAKALEPADGSWVARWIGVCHRRDDVEGVFLLLREAGHGARLGLNLSVVDREGRMVAFNVPRRAVPADERMRRVALRDPNAWWGALEERLSE